MRQLIFLLIMAWSTWAYAQPSLLQALEKEYKQQLLDQLPDNQAAHPPMEDARLCPTCPGEELQFREPTAPFTVLRGTEIELRDSTVCYRYDPSTETWELSSKAVYNYNEEHLLTETTGYSWQDSWVFKSRHIQSYNEAGQVVESTYQQWEEAGWKNTERYLDIYDEQGLRTEFLYQQWEENLGGWQTFIRRLYSYDEQGRLDEGLSFYDPNFPSGTLIQRSKSIYEYADSDDPVSVTLYLFDPSANYWSLSFRTLYQYYAPGTVSEILQQVWSRVEGEWNNFSRYYYVFDENGYRTESVSQSWEEGWLNRSRALFENDAAGNTLKQTSQTWNESAEDWQNTDQFTFSYDERNREMERYSREWAAIAYSWQSDHTAAIQYDEDGNQLEVVTQFWDEQAGAFANSYRSIKGYDEEGNLQSLTLQYWENGAWRTEEQFTYAYQEGLLAVETALELTGTGDTAYFERSFYAYDGRDSLTETLSQYWNPDAEEWIEAERSVITYNAMGWRADSLTQLSYGGEWFNSSRVVYTYDAAGLLIEQLEQDRQGSEDNWVNDYRSTWAYNEDGRKVEHLREWWMHNYPESYWKNEYRELYTYDEAGREASYTYQQWGEALSGYGFWHNEYRHSNIYDEGTGLLVERTFEEYNNSDASIDWELYGRQLYEYNEQGLLTFLDFQLATPSEFGWIDKSRWESYWRTVVPVAEATATDIRCITANPHTPGSPILFEGLDVNRRYELRLTGLWGRTLYRKVFEGGATLRLSSGLPPGLYVLSLHDEGGLAYRQKLIIQSP